MHGRIDLTRARREAKARLAAMRADDPAAKLSDAQLAIAREWGERSWPALVRRAEAQQPLTPLTPLARAAGDAARTSRLLDAGADPRDEEAVRRAAAADDPSSLRLLLDAGADPQRTLALATVLEREDPDAVALLLDRLPADSGERAWSLLWAVQHGRSEEMLRLLVARGADLEAYDEANDRRPYGLAIRRGRRDLAELLASLGAQRRAGPVDEMLGAARSGDSAEARRLAAERPEALALLRGAYAGALAEAAGDGLAETVRILLELGVPANARAESGLTPLQAASGDAEIEALLLAHGADPRKPAVPPAVAPSAIDFGELMWEAEVTYLRQLATAPGVESRPIGDGIAVRSGVDSNTENGVIANRATDAEIAEALAFLGGAPAQWFVKDPTDLRPRLVAAGATPERTGVVMGRPLDSPPAEVDDVEIVAHRLDTPVEHRVAVRNGQSVGSVTWMQAGETVYGLHLTVPPECRRQGIGGALLRRALSEGHSAGARAAVLGPTPETIAFYRLLGFELRPYVQERSFYLP